MQRARPCAHSEAANLASRTERPSCAMSMCAQFVGCCPSGGRSGLLLSDSAYRSKRLRTSSAKKGGGTSNERKADSVFCHYGQSDIGRKKNRHAAGGEAHPLWPRVKAPGSPRNWHLDDPDAVLACPAGPAASHWKLPASGSSGCRPRQRPLERGRPANVRIYTWYKDGNSSRCTECSRSC